MRHPGGISTACVELFEVSEEFLKVSQDWFIFRRVWINASQSNLI